MKLWRNIRGCLALVVFYVLVGILSVLLLVLTIKIAGNVMEHYHVIEPAVNFLAENLLIGFLIVVGLLALLYLAVKKHEHGG